MFQVSWQLSWQLFPILLIDINSNCEICLPALHCLTALYRQVSFSSTSIVYWIFISYHVTVKNDTLTNKPITLLKFYGSLVAVFPLNLQNVSLKCLVRWEYSLHAFHTMFILSVGE